MRARDCLGFPLIALGLSAVSLGHHWFGPLLFWAGVPVLAIGIAIAASGGLQRKIDEAWRSYRGGGDFGDRHYHGGGDLPSHGRGSDAGGGDVGTGND
ncbi:hypothetical protein [Variovorax sp. GB1P17]|uniref:hypothetical protein n=1 Tax=Variovorax sp. GB1P17 TaxID=3443740 RepID=UPI003F47BBB7